MRSLGNALGLSYKEICVIGNLYLQGGVLWLVGVASAIESYRLLHRANSRFSIWKSVWGILDGIVSTVLFTMLLFRYPGGGAPAFDLCVHDLNWLASKFHTTYEIINIVVFVIAFLGILALQITLCLSVRHTRRATDAKTS